MLSDIGRNRERIEAICRRNGVRKLDLFGSAARGDFDPERSDIDLFYEFDPSDSRSVADRYFGMWDELEAVLGFRVELVSAKDASNPYFLEVANRHRVTLYAAGDAEISA